MENIIVHVDHIVYRETNENWNINERTISNHELVFIVEGEGVINIEDKKYHVSKNDLIYFYPGQRHKLSVTKHPFMFFYGVHFQLFSENQKLPIEEVSHIENSFKLYTALKDLYTAWIRKEYMFQWKQNILMQTVLFEIFSEAHERIVPINIMRINKVLDFIHSNPYIKYKIEVFLDLTGLKKSHFIKMFKDMTGQTPINYTLKLKLEHGKRMLINNEGNIKDVAYACGFEDEFYFSRLFKKNFGYSPRKFRSILLFECVLNK